MKAQGRGRGEEGAGLWPRRAVGRLRASSEPPGCCGLPCTGFTAQIFCCEEVPATLTHKAWKEKTFRLWRGSCPAQVPFNPWQTWGGRAPPPPADAWRIGYRYDC